MENYREKASLGFEDLNIIRNHSNVRMYLNLKIETIQAKVYKIQIK